MNKVYKPISEFCPVYINDALIFSDSEKERVKHLMKFKDLTYTHCLALSESKIKIRLEEIDFLRLHIKDGHIILQPHIVEKISQFINKLLSRKQIQRLLGIINYAVDLIHNLTKLTSHILKHP